MYDVIFYEDKNGRKEIEEHLLMLKEKRMMGIKMREFNLIKLSHILIH